MTVIEISQFIKRPHGPLDAASNGERVIITKGGEKMWELSKYKDRNMKPKRKKDVIPDVVSPDDTVAPDPGVMKIMRSTGADLD